MKESTAIKEEKAMVPTSGRIVSPVVTAQEAVDAWNQYVELKKSITEEADVQVIQGRKFLKKSYWRKINKFFNLSLEKIDESEKVMKALIRVEKKKRKNRKTGEWFEAEERQVEYYPMEADLNPKQNEAVKLTTVFSATYRAKAGNGAFADGDGHCDTWEKGYPNSYHNAKATAHTRAKNRAISDLVGGGEVSAEEITGEVGGRHEEDVIDITSRNYETRTDQFNGKKKALEACETVEALQEVWTGLTPKDKTLLVDLKNELKRKLQGDTDPEKELAEEVFGEESPGETVSDEPSESEAMAIVFTQAIESISVHKDSVKDALEKVTDIKKKADKEKKDKKMTDEDHDEVIKAINKKLSEINKLSKGRG